MENLNDWVLVKDDLPPPFQTVWLTNFKGSVALGCRVIDSDGWCWAESNGVMYVENGKIVAECESQDLDVKGWHKVPTLPN